jgi:putative hydrolase of the HAD superfamily
MRKGNSDQPVSCVLFDLDNTLTDRTTTISRFSSRFLGDFQPELRSTVTLEAVHQVMRAGDGGGYRPKETMFREIQSMLDWVQVPDISVIADYWYQVSAECMQLRVGAAETLDSLRERGYPLGIITNGKTLVQNATIDAVGIRDYFSLILVSETVGVRKPDPRLFQLALEELQCQGQATLFVGDHPQSDIEGARGAGLQTAWLAGMHPWPLELEPADYILSDLPQLLAILP